MSQLNESYYPANIQILPDHMHIRRRPRMYIGDTDVKGLHYLLFGLITNSVEEFSISPLDHVLVEFFPDGSCRVQDWGRGIPLERFSHSAELFFTAFIPGWKKDAKYWRKGGMLRGWLKFVNALSQRFRVEIARNGQLWLMEFERGEVIRPLSAIKATPESGTTITFWPDPEIFTSRPSFELPTILERLTDFAVANPGLRFVVRDHRCSPLVERDICYPQGLPSRVGELNQTRELVHPTVFYCQEKADDHEVEIALQWSMANEELMYFLVNGCRTSDGTPKIGFHRALSGTLRKFGRATGLLSGQYLGGERIRAGLTAILSVKVREPQWYGATKTKLANPEIQTFVETTMNKHFAEFLYAHPEEADAICGRIQFAGAGFGW